MTRLYALKMKALRLALSAMLASPLVVLAAGGARIEFAVGGVVATSPAGGQRSLVKGAEVVSGETVRTAADGRAQLRFDDGAMISLQPETEFRLDNYHFAGKQDGQERGFFSLLKGGLRTITGLIGRNNRGTYKVTTSVATIGIRGTEYTLAYTGRDSLAIATGEGAIEVCAGGRCAVLSSGESGVVEGADGQLRRVDFRPVLAPAQLLAPVLPQFATSEFRNGDGSVLLNGNQLLSGPGYTVAFAHSSTGGVVSGGTAEFGSNSQFLSGTDGNAVYKGDLLGESASADGVIGWGRWTSAVGQTPPNPPVNLTNFHYVVGKETPVSQLTALSGTTAVYQLIGFTVPTGSLGYSTGAPSGTLTATVGAASMNVSMALQVPYFNSMTTTTYAVNRSTGTIPIAGSFSWTAASGGGLFSGAGASHAGATYNFSAGGYTDVSGAVAFKR